MEYGADINRVVSDCTLLLAATQSCDLDTVRLALSLGADPNLECPLSIASDTGRHDVTFHWTNLECPLFVASDAGRHDIMGLLVEHGADVDRIEKGQTLLGLAMKDENLEDVRFVLLLGADPNVGDPMWGMLESCVVQGCNACVHEDIALLMMEQDVALLIMSRYG